MNQEPSPDRLAFQIAHTTICPNYPGEELQTLDREVLVISADVPPQDGETNEQHQERENANATRAVRQQQELAAAVPAASQQLVNAGQVNDNTGQQAPAAPATPQPLQQDNQPRASRLRARDLLRDFEWDGREVYNSPQTNLGAALAALNHLEDSPDVFKLTSVSPSLKLKKKVLDIVDQQQVPTTGADQNILANDVVTMVPLSRWLKRDEVKTK
jgi:hypothetical protein